MNKTLRAQADELIFTLNAIACKYDQRSFGLPVFEGEAIRDRMINAVLELMPCSQHGRRAMGELKFRAWIEEYKELCRVLSIDFVNNEFCVLPDAELEGGSQVVSQGLEKLEQYTGLHDKNGREIYEGDILRSDEPERLRVEWNGDWACWDFAPLNSWDIDREYIEIVGNIHENPELLEASHG